MIDAIQAAFERAEAWFEIHPSISAFFVGWCLAIPLTQFAKRFYPANWSDLRVKLVSQTIAIVSATAMTFHMWPDESPHGFAFALLSGMSAPQAYSGLKIILPNLMRRWGWDCIQEKKIADGS